MLRYLLLVISVVATTKGCCLPKQWEGKTFTVYTTEMDGNSGYYEVMGTVVSDADKKMVYYNQTVQGLTNGVPVKFVQQELQDYNTKTTYYSIDGNCTITNTTLEPFFCTGDEIIEHSYIGAGANKIPTTMYRHRGVRDTTYTTVIDDGCIPVVIEQSALTDTGSYKFVAEFFGITPGISDASVFKRLNSCMSS